MQDPTRLSQLLDSWESDAQGPSDPRLGSMLDSWEKEATGFEWLRAGVSRAARGIGDVATRTVDNSTWLTAKAMSPSSWFEPNLGMWTPLPEPEVGVVGALTGKDNPDFLDVVESVVPGVSAEGTRQIHAEKLGTSEVGFQILGELAGYAVPYGPSALVGQAAAKTATSVAEGIAGSVQPFQKAAQLLVKQGKMTGEAMAAAAKEGRLAYEVAKASGWGKPAQWAAYGLDASARLGPYAAMVGQMTAAAPREQMAEVALHTAMMGPIYLLLGRAGADVGGWVTKGITSKDTEAALYALGKELTGEMGATAGVKLKALWSGWGAPLVGNGVGAAFESMGFQLTDAKSFDLMMRAFNGDPQAMEEFGANFLGTMAGMMVAHGIAAPKDAQWWKRIRPDMNSLENLVALEQAKRQAQAVEGEIQGQQKANQEAIDVPAYSPYVNPLLRAGMNVEAMDPMAGVQMRDPVSGEQVGIRLTKPEAVTITRKVWDTLRGGEPPTRDADGRITLGGDDAKLLLTEMAARSSSNHLLAATELEPLGMRDTGQGFWRDDAGLRDISIGLDGRYRARAFGETKWEPVDLQDQLIASLGRQGPEPEMTPNQTLWADFLSYKSKMLSDPLVDRTMQRALYYALRGEGAKAKEMAAFFESVRPEDVMALFSPENALVMAHQIGSIAAGYGNADFALKQLAIGNDLAGRERALAAQESQAKKQQKAVEAQRKKTPTPEGQEKLDAKEAELSAEQQRIQTEKAKIDKERQDLLKLVGKRLENQNAWEAALERGDPVSRPLTLADLEAPPVEVPVKERPKVEAKPEEPAKPDDGREGERGSVLAEAPDAALSALRSYFRPMADEVAGLPGGRDAAEKAERVIDAIFDRIGPEDAVRQEFGRKLSRSPFNRKRRAAVDWLTELVETGDGMRSSRFQLLNEGGEFGKPNEAALRETIPAEFRELVDYAVREYQGLRVRTGRDNIEAGALDYNPQSKQYEPKRINEAANVYVRSARPEGKYSDAQMREAWTKIAQRNGIADVDAFVEKVMGEEGISPFDRSRQTAERLASMDFKRQLKHMPTEVTLADGTVVKMLDANPVAAFESLIRQYQRNAVIREFGQQGIPAEVRKAYGREDKPGIDAYLENYGKQKGVGEKDVAAMRKLLETLSGQPGEGYWLSRWFSGRVGNLIKSGQLSLTWLPDLISAPFLAAKQAGSLNTLKSLLSFEPFRRQFERDMQEAGVVLQEMTVETLRHRSEGPAQAVAATIAEPGRRAQKLQSRIVASAVKRVVAQMQAGKNKLTNSIRLSKLGFDSQQIDAMVNGRADASLYKRYLRKATHRGTGELMLFEGSRLLANPKFTGTFWYQRFWANRINEHVQAVRALRDGLRSGDAKQAIAGIGEFVKYAGLSVLGGMVQLLVYESLREQSLARGARNLLNKDGIPLVGEALSAFAFGGLPKAAAMIGWDALMGWTGVKQVTEGDVLNRVASTISPLTPFRQLVDMSMGSGPYANSYFADKVMTFVARSLPIAKQGGAMAATMLGYSSPETSVARSEAFRILNRIRGTRFEPQATDAQRPDLAKAMKKLRNEIIATTGDANQLANLKPYLETALGEGTGAEIARRLRSMQIVSRLDPEELSKVAAELSPAHLERNYQYDRALETVAKLVEMQKGTPEARDLPPLTTRLEMARQQMNSGNMGDVYADIWRDVREAAIESGNLDELREFSTALADWPEAVGKVFDEALAEKMQGRSTSQRYRMIYGRLADRVQNARREARKEAVRAAR